MYISYALIMQRKQILDQIIDKKMKIKEASELLGVTRQTTSKWLAQYKLKGIKALEGKRPGPKKGFTPYNKTSLAIEQIVVELARTLVFEGPIALAERLEDDHERNKVYNPVHYTLLQPDPQRGFSTRSKQRKKFSKKLKLKTHL